MSAKIEKISSNKIKIDMQITADKFEEGLNRAFVKNRARFNIPGFRRGKAPRQIVERHYGESVLFEDAFDIVFPEEYGSIIDENKLMIVSRPELDIKKINKQEGIECVLEVYVKPDVELSVYKGVNAKKIVYEVKEEDITDELKRKQEQNARFVDADRPAREGDRVIIDYDGTLEGAAFEGGKAENQMLEIGAGRFIPGFEEQIVGMKKDEEKDITVKFPDDYNAEDLKGREAVFHIKMHDIKEKELPVLDDEFAKDISEFETLDELKKDIETRLKDNAEKKARSQMEDEVIKIIIDGAKTDIPEAMCESQIDNQIAQLEYNLMSQGIKMDDYLNYIGAKLEDIREQQKDTAYNIVKTKLVLEAIMKKEEIAAGEEDVDEYVKKAAARAKKTPEEYRKLIGEEMLAGIKDRLSMDKTINMLMENAVFEEEKKPVKKDKKTKDVQPETEKKE